MARVNYDDKKLNELINGFKENLNNGIQTSLNFYNGAIRLYCPPGQDGHIGKVEVKIESGLE